MGRVEYCELGGIVDAVSNRVVALSVDVLYWRNAHTICSCSELTCEYSTDQDSLGSGYLPDRLLSSLTHVKDVKDFVGERLVVDADEVVVAVDSDQTN